MNKGGKEVIKETIKDYESKAISLLQRSNEYKQGDNVIIYKSPNWGMVMIISDIVKKVTPTGQVSLEKRDTRFKNGREMGTSVWDCGYTLHLYNQESINLYNKATELIKASTIVAKNINFMTEEEMVELAIKLTNRKTQT